MNGSGGFKSFCLLSFASKCNVKHSDTTFFTAVIIHTLMDDSCCYNTPCFYSQELFRPLTCV